MKIEFCVHGGIVSLSFPRLCVWFMAHVDACVYKAHTINLFSSIFCSSSIFLLIVYVFFFFFLAYLFSYDAAYDMGKFLLLKINI